jgi:hypothetical protein
VGRQHLEAPAPLTIGSWLQVKNARFSKLDGRRELFEQRRDHARRRDGQVAPEDLRLG